MNLLEYAVKLREWQKARKIINLFDCKEDKANFILKEGNCEYTYLGILLKEKRADVFEGQLDKFNMDNIVCKFDGREYSGRQYIDILKDQNLD